MDTYAIIPIIILILVISIAIFLVFRPHTTLPSINVNGPFDLSTTQSVIPMTLDNNGFLKQSGGTFQCFIYMDNLAKTGEVSTCGTERNQPSCGSGLYDTCPCSSVNDCGNCGHPGYRHLFSLYGVYTLEMMNAPDASRQNSVACQLTIRTTDMKTSFIETIPLPPLPVQKWAMITITKEGRQISIYYNDELVSSSKTMNLPTNTNVGGYVANAGAPGLSGSIGLFYLAATTATSADIAAIYTHSTDTRGSPNSIEAKPTEVSMAVQFQQSSPILGSSFSLPQVGKVGLVPILGGDGKGSQVSPLYDVRSSYA